jgi:hypothetical protein
LELGIQSRINVVRCERHEIVVKTLIKVYISIPLRRFERRRYTLGVTQPSSLQAADCRAYSTTLTIHSFLCSAVIKIGM